jgi:hypothetical protein
MKFVFQWNDSIFCSAPGGAMACVGAAVWDGLVEGGSVSPGLPAGNNSDHVLAFRGWSPPTQSTGQKAEYEGKHPDCTNRIEN